MRMRALAFAVALLVWLASPADAFAHALGVSKGDYELKGATVAAEIVFARKEVIALAAEIDADRDGSVSDAELASAKGLIERKMAANVSVTSDDKPCTCSL